MHSISIESLIGLDESLICLDGYLQNFRTALSRDYRFDTSTGGGIEMDTTAMAADRLWTNHGARWHERQHAVERKTSADRKRSPPAATPDMSRRHFCFPRRLAALLAWGAWGVGLSVRCRQVYPVRSAPRRCVVDQGGESIQPALSDPKYCRKAAPRERMEDPGPKPKKQG